MRFPRMAVVLAGIAVAACGPTVPLDLAMRAIPEDIILGDQGHRPAPTPSPVFVFVPPPVFIVPPGPVYHQPVPTPEVPKACPVADALATPEQPAAVYLSGAPNATTYVWRLNGTYQKGSAKTPFPAGGYRVVNNVTQPDPAGTYTFDVTDTAGGEDGRAQVTTTFRVIPQSANPPAGQTITQAAGIFISQIATKGGTTFIAGAPLTIINLPVSAGQSWDTASSDPTSQTTISLHGSIDSTTNAPGGHRHVDACGRIIDAWEVHATGSLVSPTQNITIDWYYDIATQFGGIMVQETEMLTGPDTGLANPSAISSHVATIDTVPGI